MSEPSCDLCDDSGSYGHWVPVPLEQLSERQRAELMVNGGEYRRWVVVPCPQC